MTTLRLEFGLLLLLFLVSCGAKPQKQVHLQGRTMGTFYNLKIVTDLNQQVDRHQVISAIDKKLQAFDLELSNWNAQSWVTQFNQKETKESKMPQDTQAVIEMSLELYQKSEGAFDITVSPLLELWGFGKNNHKEKPEAKALEKVLAEVGSSGLQVEGQKIIKIQEPRSINCSALAKGYGVDLIAQLLESQFKYQNYMIEIGGEIRTKGSNEKGEAWKVAIQKPDLNESYQTDFMGVVQLNQNAMATSGDYQNYFIFEGQMMPHVFNPKTGMPVQHQLCSVTVIAKNCALADGLATACLVLGPEKSLDLLKQYPGSEAFFVERLKDGTYKQSRSPGFSKYEVSLE